MRYSYPPILAPILNLERPLKEWSFTRLLFLVGTPLIALVMLAMTVSTYRITTHYLGRAYARNAHTRALALAHELQQVLIEARYDLEHLAHTNLSAEYIQHYMMGKPTAKRSRYAEVAFHAVDTKQNFLLLNTGEQMWRVPDDKASEIKFGTFSKRERVEGGITEYVQIEQPVQVYYTSVPLNGSVENIEYSVIRLSKPILDAKQGFLGYLTLSVDILELQRIMTLFSTPQSPLYIFPQAKERVRSFFFDVAGWLICETGSTSPGRAHVSINDIRTGLQGDVGRPGFASAFRPSPQYEKYWAVVTAVQTGRDGEADFSNFLSDPANPDRDHFLYFVPIRFQEEVGRDPVIVGGLGSIDGSFMLKSSRYEIALALSVSWFAALILAAAAFFYINRRISKPLKALTAAAEIMALSDETSTLDFSPLPKEMRHLQRAMNVILLQLHAARNETQNRQNQAYEELQRQPVCLESMINSLLQADPSLDKTQSPRIIGAGPSVRELNAMIHKASQVAADVLVIGETGTGKELTAEAIHRSSTRANGPFVSINCGALDENLLMDALFGHVKGAFSEAKTDRKGAFLAASGGTLHLDEIGNASPKVQQSLLRALAARSIRPLGSDQEQSFDARVIAATNVDLLECAKNGSFREDLYYRLAVITITTPPLRKRKEDIPALVQSFLAEESRSNGRKLPDLSRGALDKLLQYDWPGNIRELKNCITRAMTFAEGQILLAEHIVLDQPKNQTSDNEPGTSVSPQLPPHQPPLYAPESEDDSRRQTNLERVPHPGPRSRGADQDSRRTPDLNPRQKKAWPAIVAAGGTNRAFYQSITGEEISVRTAQYDLQDMVNKGVLIKTGKGPSSRYVLAYATSDTNRRG
jgi:DNA-binding NtrC family response regulator